MGEFLVPIEDIVGKQENVSIIYCSICKKESIQPIRNSSNSSSLLIEDNLLENYFCPNCNQFSSNCSFNFGKRFICPDCHKENVVILEPSCIKFKKNRRSFIFSTPCVTCMFCETEFGSGVIVEEKNNPQSILFRLHLKKDV